VARDDGDSDGQAERAHEPRECMACRGSGRVISNLGGAAGELACPWCEGTGMRPASVDAQAAWIERHSAGGADEPAA
jgi:DnaJ-class molecular chaperone